MSAWVCSDEHISAIVSMAVILDLRDEIEIAPADLGQALLRENVRSVLFRYDESTLGDAEVVGYADQIAGYTFQQVSIAPVEALKLLHSWQYQTCETKDYATTEAWLLSERIEQLCIRALPGYREAAWSL